MSRVQRDSVAGRAYLDVQNLARRTRRPTAELLHAYVLEGFLVRLTGSPEADALVLKGGVLLAAFSARRPTRDIDLAARDLSGEVDDVLALVRRIAGVDVDDPSTPGWSVVGRLLRPLDAVNAALDSPVTSHRVAR